MNLEGEDDDLQHAVHALVQRTFPEYLLNARRSANQRHKESRFLLIQLQVVRKKVETGK